MKFNLDQYEVSFKNFSFGTTRILPKIIIIPQKIELDDNGSYSLPLARSIEIEFEIDSPGRSFRAINGSSGQPLKINPEIFRQQGELILEINGQSIIIGQALLLADFPNGNRLRFALKQ